ncbi:MAG: GNAT family N-acetyltransferase [Phycisphaeraceae bacterium JB051]
MHDHTLVILTRTSATDPLIHGRLWRSHLIADYMRDQVSDVQVLEIAGELSADATIPQATVILVNSPTLLADEATYLKSRCQLLACYDVFEGQDACDIPIASFQRADDQTFAGPHYAICSNHAVAMPDAKSPVHVGMDDQFDDATLQAIEQWRCDHPSVKLVMIPLDHADQRVSVSQAIHQCQLVCSASPDILQEASLSGAMTIQLASDSSQRLVARDYVQHHCDDVRALLGLLDTLVANPKHLLAKLRYHFVHGEQDSLANIASLLQVCRVLQWDSDFYGIRIGYLMPRRVNDAIVAYALAFCQKHDIQCMYYLCDCYHLTSSRLAEKHHCNFVDIRLTMERRLNQNMSLPALPDGYTIRLGVEKDIASLLEIAGDAYRHSRYFFDTRFDVKKCQQFYQDWIRKAVHGTFDDGVWVLCQNDKPVGYCTFRHLNDDVSQIGLVGMSPDMTGKGLASRLIEYTLAKESERGCRIMLVVTQGRNYPAQRLYQRTGFLTREAALWYHKWYD